VIDPLVFASAMDEFVEPADFSGLGLFLVEEGKFRLVEFFEEFAPGEHVQCFVLGIEIQPQNSRIAGAFQIGNGGWFSATHFRPVQFPSKPPKQDASEYAQSNELQIFSIFLYFQVSRLGAA